MKRIITFILAVAMLASILVLSSCGLMQSKVEKMASKVIDAKSLTIVYIDDDGDEEIFMIDLKNKMFAYIEEDDEEGYFWYDEENDKYYEAYVEDDEVKKYELTKAEFAFYYDELFGDFLDEMVGYTKLVDLMEEEKGVYSYTYEYYDEDVKVEFKVEDNALVMTEFFGDYESTYKVYDINKTEIEIPQDVLDAKAEKDD